MLAMWCAKRNDWYSIKPMDDSNDLRLVTVARFSNLGQLAVARSLLESFGIEYFVRNEHTARIGGPFAAAVSADQAELQVRETDADDATALLNSSSGALE